LQRRSVESQAECEVFSFLLRSLLTVNHRFLYAKLQLEALRNCVSALDVEETLEVFPTDIQAIYMRTWERICAQGPKLANLAKLVLLWITHAQRELTIDTLRRGVATSPDTYVYEPKHMVPEALLLSVCCGLVSVDEKTRRARLTHESHPCVIIVFHLSPFLL
jgi:ankyrin repeat domain-containing protein 50